MLTLRLNNGWRLTLVVMSLLSACHHALGQEAIAPAAVAPVTRPNIVLILADDLGFSDLASYGSEIQTPTLSALAENGVSFTNYHTAASCAPTRAMLLTGVDSHRAGVPNIPEMIPPEQRQHAHYQGVLGRNGGAGQQILHIYLSNVVDPSLAADQVVEVRHCLHVYGQLFEARDDLLAAPA